MVIEINALNVLLGIILSMPFFVLTGVCEYINKDVFVGFCVCFNLLVNCNLIIIFMIFNSVLNFLSFAY